MRGVPDQYVRCLVAPRDPAGLCAWDTGSPTMGFEGGTRIGNEEITLESSDEFQAIVGVSSCVPVSRFSLFLVKLTPTVKVVPGVTLHPAFGIRVTSGMDFAQTVRTDLVIGPGPYTDSGQIVQITVPLCNRFDVWASLSNPAAAPPPVRILLRAMIDRVGPIVGDNPPGDDGVQRAYGDLVTSHTP